MKPRLMTALRGALLCAPLCLALPTMSGCGTSLDDLDDAFDQLWEDLEDADDFDDFDEAWEDFFEELDD